MKFSECIPLLLDGKKIKKEEWNQDFVCFDCGVLKLYHGHELKPFILSPNDLCEKGWIEKVESISLNKAINLIETNLSEIISFNLTRHELIVEMEASCSFECAYSGYYKKIDKTYIDNGTVLVTYSFTVEANCNG